MYKVLFLLAFIMFLSCQNSSKDEKLNPLVKERKNDLLLSFREVSLDSLKKVELDNFIVEESQETLDSIFISNLCIGVVNNCFYTKSSYKNEYYSLFKTKYSDDICLFFYLVAESPVDIKKYVALVKNNKINSKLLISTFSPNVNTVIDFKLSEKLEFLVTKSYEEDTSVDKIKEEVLIREVYKIDEKKGVFYLNNSPEILKNKIEDKNHSIL